MDNNTTTGTKTIVRDKCRIFSVLGGVCVLLCWVIPFVDNLNFGGIPMDKVGIWFAELGICLLFAVGLLIGKKNAFLRVSLIAYVLCELGLDFVKYETYGFSFSALIWYIVTYGTFIFIIWCNCGSEVKLNSLLKKIYFVPAAVRLVMLCLSLISSFSELVNGSYGISSIVLAVIDILMLFFVSKWAVNELEYITVSADSVSAMDGVDGYVDLAKHVLLLLFTFGIWMYIWIYRTTAYLNKCDKMEARTPANQLLLCLFVPFYVIYWTYQSALRVDYLAREKGMNESLATLCLVLEIFVPIVPPILMQSKINSVISAPQTGNRIAPNNVGENGVSSNTPVSSADELKKFKDLFDSGAITEEEYEAKKKQLLGL